MAMKSFGYIILLSILKTVLASNVNNVHSLQSDTNMICDRSFWAEEPVKTPDVRFRIRVDNNLVLYAPKNKYHVYLEAIPHNSRFTKFILTVDSLNHSDPGAFELENKALTTFSGDCPNTIIQTSFTPKNVIAVLWKAPIVDSGCVLIRGAVYDTADKLHHSGNLSLKLCQGELNENVLPEVLETCGACDEASYQLIFEGLWSRQTHPKEFPQYPFGIGFQGVIGASHSNSFKLWEFKKNASNGIAEVANTGNTKELEAELKAQSKLIRTVIKAKNLSHPNLNNKTYAKFRTDDKNHLMSLIAKISPSPDWVVGLSALELCLSNNSWATSRVVNLFPIDVGTMEGATYYSAKVPTMPRSAIRQISATENSDSPFYSEIGEIQPLAKLTVYRQRIFGKATCITDGSSNHECAVTKWINDGPCNCRTRLQRRKRKFKNYKDKYNKNCKVSLIYDFPCSCNVYPTTEYNAYVYRPSTESFTTSYPVSCDTTEWGSWTECTCHNPYRSRYRYYKNSASTRGCTELLWEKEDCIDMSTCDPLNRRCSVTEWSEWSPCNATCEMTMGMRLRTRLFFNPTTSVNSCDVHTIETEPCVSERADCNGSPEEVCFEPKEEGPCRGYFPRWYYNVQEKRCVNFVYGGCRANRNNFNSYSECHRVCGNALIEPSDNLSKPSTPDDPNLVVDCELSQWGEWSQCSSTCSPAWKARRRTVEINAQNGGQPCDNKRYHRRKCKGLPPCVRTY